MKAIKNLKKMGAVILGTSFLLTSASVWAVDYEIRTVQQLDAVRNDLTGNYKLMNNLDLSGVQNWNPIGSASAPFVGKFDGGGFALSNLTIRGETRGVGLFGTVKTPASISNLTINKASVSNTEYWAAVLIGAAISTGSGLVKVSNIKIIDSAVETPHMAAGVVSNASEGGIELTNITVDKLLVSGDGSYNAGVLSFGGGNIVMSAVHVKNSKILGVGAVGGIIGTTFNDLSSNLKLLSITDSQALSGGSYAGGILGTTSSKDFLLENFYVQSVDVSSVNGFEAGGVIGLAINTGSVGLKISKGYVNADVDSRPAYSGMISGGAFNPINVSNTYYNSDVLNRLNVGAGQWVYNAVAKETRHMRCAGYTCPQDFPGFDFANVWTDALNRNNNMPFFKYQK